MVSFLEMWIWSLAVSFLLLQRSIFYSHSEPCIIECHENSVHGYDVLFLGNIARVISICVTFVSSSWIPCCKKQNMVTVRSCWFTRNWKWNQKQPKQKNRKYMLQFFFWHFSIQVIFFRRSDTKTSVVYGSPNRQCSATIHISAFMTNIHIVMIAASHILNNFYS